MRARKRIAPLMGPQCRAACGAPAHGEHGEIVFVDAVPGASLALQAREICGHRAPLRGVARRQRGLEIAHLVGADASFASPLLRQAGRGASPRWRRVPRRSLGTQTAEENLAQRVRLDFELAVLALEARVEHAFVVAQRTRADRRARALPPIRRARPAPRRPAREKNPRRWSVCTRRACCRARSDPRRPRRPAAPRLIEASRAVPHALMGPTPIRKLPCGADRDCAPRARACRRACERRAARRWTGSP